MPAAELGNAELATQAVQNDADFFFGGMALTCCTPDVLHDPLGNGR
jgi:hypothetical protein